MERRPGMRRHRIGFIVNPIAGMGGRVGLKGTDGEAYRLAVEKGAEPVAPGRALRFLSMLKRLGIEERDAALYTVEDPMGLGLVEEAGLAGLVEKVFHGVSRPTTGLDTYRASSWMKEMGVDVIVFVGGDGTARDVYRAVDAETPVIGVPSGVKMYSGVFAATPEDAARLLIAFLDGETVLVEEEVLDIDEEAFRRDILRLRLYGYMRVPYMEGLVAGSKQLWMGVDEEENKRAIARRIVEDMRPGVLYLLGPGSTVKAIADLLGVEKTLLGVDAVLDGRLVGRDLDEKGILELLSRHREARIIVTPIGGQGYIFGRGNQQFSPRVIRRVGRDNIIVVATRRKIRSLRYLRVDTGDPVVDEMLRGYIKVIIDYYEAVMMRVV